MPTKCRKLAGCIREATKEFLGISRGGGSRLEGAWSWNEEVKEKVKDKQNAYAASSIVERMKRKRSIRLSIRMLRR